MSENVQQQLALDCMFCNLLVELLMLPLMLLLQSCQCRRRRCRQQRTLIRIIISLNVYALWLGGEMWKEVRNRSTCTQTHERDWVEFWRDEFVRARVRREMKKRRVVEIIPKRITLVCTQNFVRVHR